MISELNELPEDVVASELINTFKKSSNKWKEGL